MNSQIKQVCKKCGEEKLLTEFHKNSHRKNGHVTRCKACAKKQRKENKKIIQERNKKYYEDNKEKILISRKIYYEKKGREYHKKWVEENRERVQECRRLYYQNNKERSDAHSRQAQHRRRARLKNNDYEYFTEQELIEHWIENKIDPEKCFYCEVGKYEHKDHYIPTV